MTSTLDQDIKKLTTLVHPGGIGYAKDDAARAWGILENGLHVKTQNINDYQRVAKDVYRRTCENDYSFSHFEQRFLSAFKETIQQENHPDDKAVKAFRDSLKHEPDRHFLVTRDIHGVIFKEARNLPLTLGPYVIYHFESHRQMLLPANEDASLLWDQRTPNYLIGVTVKAKHKDRAIEKADELFDKFEKACRFMVGPDDRHDVKILNSYGRHARNAYVFCKDDFASGSFSWHGPFEAIPIDDAYFSSNDLGYDKLWDYLGSKQPKPLQAKIAMAALWLGQAYEEKSESSAFIKAAISLEVLFTVNEKSVINPSILSQICETVACLLGRNAEERLAFEKSLKKFYAIRSAVAHAGKLDVTDEDLSEFTLLARRALMKILRTPDLSEMDTPEQLNLHIKKLKYSFQGI